MTLEERIVRSIANRQGNVVLRSELAPLGSPTQVTRALAALVEKGRLARIGRGIYAKTRKNRYTGEPTPAGTLESLAGEAFRKLGVAVRPGRLAQEYNSGRSTQIPMQAIVDTGKRRISRKISVGGRSIAYENARHHP